MEKKKITRLILIFDANSGNTAALIDSAKKLFMIKVCSLCSITHDIVGEKKEWKSCKVELGVPITYFHREEITNPIRQIIGENIPCIIAQAEKDLVLLVKPDVLERCNGKVADLRARLNYYAAIKNLEFPSQSNEFAEVKHLTGELKLPELQEKRNDDVMD